MAPGVDPDDIDWHAAAGVAQTTFERALRAEGVRGLHADRCVADLQWSRGRGAAFSTAGNVSAAGFVE